MKRQMKTFVILGLIALFCFSISITAVREGINVELSHIRNEKVATSGINDLKTTNPEDQEYKTNFISEGITKVGEFDSDYGNAYEFTKSGSRLYVAGLSGGVSIVDINNPDEPEVIGNFWDGGTAHKVTFRSGDLYVADGTDGIEVLDDVDVDSIKEVQQYYDGGTCYDIDFVSQIILYVADGSDGLEIFEILSNGSLIKRGSYTSGITDCLSVSVDISNNLAFLSCGSDGIIVLDILDPVDPEYVTTLHQSNSDTRSVEYEEDILYVADGEAGFKIYNYSNVNNITLSSEFPISQGLVENVFLQSNSDIVHVAAGNDGVYCLNTTLINNVSQIFHMTFEEGFVHDIVYSSDYLFVANDLNIKVLDLSSLTTPILRTSLIFAGQPTQIAVSEQIGLLANGIGGLDIINITNPAYPVLYSKYKPEDTLFYDVEVINTTIYCATNFGLEIVDITDLMNPVQLKLIEIGTIQSLALSNNHALLLTSSQELVVVDISTPSTATQVEQLPLAGNGLDISIEGTKAYVAIGTGGFQIIDISTPTSLSVIKTIATSNALGVFIQGTLAAIADGTAGVKLYNVSDPESVDLLDEELTSGEYNTTKVVCEGDNLFVAAMEYGAYHLNISNVNNITILGHFSDGGNSKAITIKGSLIYVADDVDSFEILGRDSDGDTIADYNEINVYGTDEEKMDTDSDGINDGEELRYWQNRLIDPLADFDDDGLGHLLDPDSDNDTILDGVEINVYNTDPINTDTDDDGITDDEEIVPGSDGYITDPTKEDTDDDGLNDYSEIYTYFTNATNPDTENDGPADGWEVFYGFDPLVNDSYFDNDTDDLDAAEEFAYDTHPFNEDTDGDALTDGEEVKTHNTDPTKKDTDGDFIDDKWEIDNSLNPLNKADGMDDADGDGLVNYDEYFFGTDPYESDTDSDGLNDKWEAYSGTDPNSPDQNEDNDKDGLTNFEEYQANTNASDPDSDDDGFLDSYELEAGTDPLNPNDYPTTTPLPSPVGDKIGGLILGIVGFTVIIAVIVTVFWIIGKKQPNRELEEGLEQKEKE